MESITFKEFEQLNFSLYNQNPVIKNPADSLVVADPSVITPDKSHDGRWHLFAHTFFGIYHYESADGTNYKQKIS